MTNLLSKLTSQISGQKTTPGSQQSSSGILHKISDAVTGQKHPQNHQSQPPPNAGGHGGYQGGQGGYGGSHGGYDGGHGGYQGGQGGYGGSQGGH
ncbi:hypothetical protein CBS147311_9331 [Penicillium roqueforti]|nr:hypothetical protein CBS147311_9331 [Penicillium roqueforti]